MKKDEFSTEIGGKKITAEFSDLADQANGSVIVKCGDTAVLATAVISNYESSKGYFPLTVDYEERFYASGEILGSRYMRKEGRPSDEAILSGRIIDRTIRPLFDQSIKRDIQVIVTVLSIGEDDPDVVAVNAVSLALATSDIPWNGPVSSVRVIKKDGEYITNPTYPERKDAELEITTCGKDGNINMIEVVSKESSEKDVSDIFQKASDEIEEFQKFQKDVVEKIGKEKMKIESVKLSEEVVALYEKEVAPKIKDVMGEAGKAKIYELENEWVKILGEQLPDENVSLAKEHYEEHINQLIHDEAIDNNKRFDGREMDEVRSLYAQAGDVSKIVHGTGIFYRGGTHIFSALTLAGPKGAQLIEGMEVKEEKTFMHHYNFPPFSSGETGRVGGTNRRAIGHGTLAEKALTPVIPPKDIFPYTIRLVSESMASNGSTSMASICGSTLALMDGGVPIKAPVAGIAIGLMMRDEKNYKILTDIQGPEDEHGDMDFKVAGTRTGVTAIQMDIKVGGIPVKILSEALESAKKARLTILDKIEEAIKEPRTKISPSAPEILMHKIEEDQIGMVIGSGGKVINEIRDTSGVDEIQIEDDGSIFITGKNGSAQKALDDIKEITKIFKMGDKITGKVVKIIEVGAIVQLNAHSDGLVHISEIAPFRVDKVEQYIKEGDKVPVVVKSVGDRGRISLSIKEADPKLFKQIASSGSPTSSNRPSRPPFRK